MSIFDMFRKRKKLKAPWSKFYTEEELNINIPNISMYDEIKETAKKYPKYVAINYLGKNITYETFIKKIDICAKGFNDLGIKKGDIVTILLPNLPEALISLYALNKLGAIANMTHPLSAEEEIRETLLATKSKYLVIYDAQYNKIKKFIKSTLVKKVIFVSPADSLNRFKNILFDLSQANKFEHHPIDPLYIEWTRFMFKSKFKKDFERKIFGKDTPAVILHSGGTSGKPKHVVIQNRAFTYAAKAEQIALSTLRPKDHVLAIMPNFHGFGLSTLMHTPLVIGCVTVLVPRFNSKKFDTLFKETTPACVIGVPTLFEALISSKNEKNLDLSCLKYVISGGDTLPKSLEDKVNDYFKKHGSSAKIVQGYGLTEALACVCVACDDKNKSGSIGIPLPGNHVKIIDTGTRKTVGPYETGEIVVHSKALMMGYLNNESETNEALQVHDDGHIWLHTGDIGYMDEDGYIFYQSRIKRMIITSGYNVYPNHIEEVIEKHPYVLQCTVVGVPHPYKQQVPKAFIVLRDGVNSVFAKAEIRDYCRKNLARYMVPSEFVFRKSLSKTKIGKVDFKKLESDIGEYDE